MPYAGFVAFLRPGDRLIKHRAFDPLGRRCGSREPNQFARFGPTNLTLYETFLSASYIAVELYSPLPTDWPRRGAWAPFSSDAELHGVVLRIAVGRGNTRRDRPQAAGPHILLVFNTKEPDRVAKKGVRSEARRSKRQ